MLELILIGMMAILIGKVAEADDESGIIWGIVSAAIGMGCVFFVPLPFLRVLIALGIVIVLMVAYRFLRRP